MKMRRLVSSLLAVLLVMSCLSAGIVATSAANADAADTAANVDVAAAGSAYEDMLSKTTVDNNYGLSETVNNGTILQAFSWSFANVEANLESIAEQGFTTIQVSPPNEIKKGTKGAKFLQSDGKNGWWMFYQPAGFQLNQSTDNALGTKAEFQSMCNKAHELGLKIIVDAVINHMGTKEGDDSNTSTDPMSHVTPRAATFESEIYNNKLFHTPWEQMKYIESDSDTATSTYDLTRRCTSGLPDLKTEDQRVQNAIYDYMDELVASGADGFRFDAAKHIETPDDISQYRSDFWTDTLKKVQTKYSDREVYAYGEILNTCGIGRPYSMYTKLFDVTDSKGYWQISNAVKSGGTVGEWNNATPSYPNSNFTSANTVLWDESHDTYVDKSTVELNATQRGKIWALVAGRKDISCVYLARPSDSTNINDMYNITLGEARKTAWSNATTKAINQFHNYFIGQSEYCTNNSGNTAYIERGNSGAIIVNLGGTTAKSVNLTNHKLTNGTYKDAITGSKFTVSGGKISGSVGSTGVAVIYENNEEVKPTDPPAPTDPPETYIVGDVDDNGEVDAVDATMVMRSAIDMAELTTKQQRAADVDGDGFVTVIDATLIQRYVAHMPVKYDIGQQKDYDPSAPVNPTVPPIVIPTTPYVEPTEPDYDDGRTIIFSNNKGFSTVNIYYWSDDQQPVEWPGVAMTYYDTNEYGEQRYTYELPEGMTYYIINDGSQQTVDVTFTGSTGVYMTEKDGEGHYEVDFYDISGSTPTPIDPDNPDPPISSGSFLLTDNFNWGSAYVYAWDADGNALNGQWPGASQAQTQTNEYGETQFICYIPEGAVGVILNNGNGEQTEDITDFSYTGYWMDGSKNELGHYKVIGWNSDGSGGQGGDDGGYSGGDNTSGSFLLTDNFGWGSAYVYAWDADGNALNGEWPGSSQAETITNDYGETQFRCYIPEGAAGVILNNGYGAQTQDITDFSYDGYWMDGSKNELGHYLVTGWNYGEGNNDGGDGGDGGYVPSVDPVVTGNTIIFSNNKGFGSVNIYYWSDDQQPVEWPGVPMTSIGQNEFGEERFTYDLPEGMTNYIITDGNSQTVDIPFTGSTGVYMTDLNGEGHYEVAFYDIGGGSVTPVDPDPVDPDPVDPPVTDGNTIIFSNNKGFSSVNIYYWADGEVGPVEWPGVPMTYYDTNEYSQDRYIFEMPAGMTNYIITDGVSQTVDVPFTGSTGVYMLDSTDGEGHYEVGFYAIDGGSVTPVDPDPVDPDPVDPPVTDGNTIIFSNNKGFSSVNIYYWADGEVGPVEWPGVPMTYYDTNEYSQDRYIFEMPAGMTNYIITDGVSQTVDVPFTGSTGVYMLDETDGEGHYQVGFYAIDGGSVTPVDPDPVDPDPVDPDPVVTDGNTIIFSNNKGFSSVNIYYWADGEVGPVEWPGVPMTYYDTNEYSQDRYTFEMPAGMTNYIITDGVSQTVDIPFTGSTGVYMLDETDGEGHYQVGFYAIDGGSVTPDPVEPDNPVVGGNDIVFEPGEASVADPAWFAWVWNTGSEGQWIQGTVSGSNIVFSGAGDFGNILVVRMPSGSSSASWDTCWNQSEDIAVQSGTLYFTGWGSGNKFNIGWK